MTDRPTDMTEAIRREREAEQMHRKLQGQDGEDVRAPAERERDSAVDEATRDVERTLDHLKERSPDSRGDSDDAHRLRGK